MPPVATFFLFMAGVIVVTVASFYLIPSHIPRNRRTSLLVPQPSAE